MVLEVTWDPRNGLGLPALDSVIFFSAEFLLMTLGKSSYLSGLDLPHQTSYI